MLDIKEVPHCHSLKDLVSAIPFSRSNPPNQPLWDGARCMKKIETLIRQGNTRLTEENGSFLHITRKLKKFTIKPRTEVSITTLSTPVKAFKKLVVQSTLVLKTQRDNLLLMVTLRSSKGKALSWRKFMTDIVISQNMDSHQPTRRRMITPLRTQQCMILTEIWRMKI